MVPIGRHSAVLAEPGRPVSVAADRCGSGTGGQHTVSSSAGLSSGSNGAACLAHPGLSESGCHYDLPGPAYKSLDNSASQ